MGTLIEILANNPGYTWIDKVLIGIIAISIVAVASLMLSAKKEIIISDLGIPKIKHSAALVLAVLVIMLVLKLFSTGKIAELWEYIACAGTLFILCIVCILAFGHFLVIKKMNDIVRKKISPTERYLLFRKVDFRNLTLSERKVYYAHLCNLYILMGNYSKAMSIVDENKKDDDPQYLMVKAFCEEKSGNLVNSADLLKESLKKCDSQKDRKKYMQMLNNCGRIYRIIGNNEEAYKYYYEALKLIDRHTDSELRDAVFQNYFATKSLLDGTEDEDLEKIINLYEKYLDVDDAEEAVKLFNARLALHRRNNAICSIQIVSDEYRALRAKCKDWVQRIHLDVSALGVMIGFGADYSEVMSKIDIEKDKILRLEMPDRTNLVLAVWMQFDHSGIYHERMISQYPDLYMSFRNYLEKRAITDIEGYYEIIPVEAVYDRCNLLKQTIVVLRQTKNDYFDKCKKTYDHIISILTDNELMIDASCAKVDKAQLLFEDSFDKRRELDNTEIKECLDEAGECFGSIYPHPVYAGQFIELAWLYSRIGSFVESEHFYNKYKETRVPDSALDGHLQAHLLCVADTLDALKYEKCIYRIKENIDIMSELSEGARAFIRKYPNVESADAAILWSILMGAETIELKCAFWKYKDESPDAIHGHEWLILRHKIYSGQEISLELDMLNAQKDRDAFLFFPGMHPLQLGTDERLLGKDVSDFTQNSEVYVEEELDCDLIDELKEVADLIKNQCKEKARLG